MIEEPSGDWYPRALGTVMFMASADLSSTSGLVVTQETVHTFYQLILERKGERETWVCCSTYLCIHWLILTGDGTCNPGGLGRHFNQ